MIRPIACAVFAAAVSSTPVLGSSVLLVPLDGNQSATGRLSTSDGTLIAVNVPGRSDEITVDWTVSFDPQTDLFTYTYTFGGVGEGVSHFNLETSLSFTHEDFVGDDRPALIEATTSNATMPADLFGIKFDFEANIYTITTDRVPIWGDIFGKKGSTGGVYNSSFGQNPTDDTDDFGGWLATPDTDVVHTPTPTAFLAGLSTLGALIVQRRRHTESGAGA